MFRYAAVFFVIALLAAGLGFTGLASDAAEIAKVMFFVFLGLAMLTLLWKVLSPRG